MRLTLPPYRDRPTVKLDAAAESIVACAYSWRSQKASPGPHAITTKGYDVAGNVDQATVTVTN